MEVPLCDTVSSLQRSPKCFLLKRGKCWAWWLMPVAELWGLRRAWDTSAKKPTKTKFENSEKRSLSLLFGRPKLSEPRRRLGGPGRAGVGIPLGGTQLGAAPSVGTGPYSRIPEADARSSADDTPGRAGRRGPGWVPVAAVRPWDTGPAVLTRGSRPRPCHRSAVLATGTG